MTNFFLVCFINRQKGIRASATLPPSKTQKACIFSSCESANIDLARHLKQQHRVGAEAAARAVSLIHEWIEFERTPVPSESRDVQSLDSLFAEFSELFSSGERQAASSSSSGGGGGSGGAAPPLAVSEDDDGHASHPVPPVPCGAAAGADVESVVADPTEVYRESVASTSLVFGTAGDAMTGGVPACPGVSRKTLLSDESPTRRWLAKCNDCSRVIVYRKIRLHTRLRPHQRLTKDGRESLLRSLEESRALVTLKAPLRPGLKNLEQHMVDPDIFRKLDRDAAERGANLGGGSGGAACLPSDDGGHLVALRQSVMQHVDAKLQSKPGIALSLSTPSERIVPAVSYNRTDTIMVSSWHAVNSANFGEAFPMLHRMLEDYRDYVDGGYILIDKCTRMRHAKMAATVLLIYVSANKLNDLTMEDTVESFRSILSCFAAHTSKGLIKNTTRTKYLTSMTKHFLSFLHSKKRSIQTTFNLADIRQESSQVVAMVGRDEHNAQLFPRLCDEKEHGFIPYAEMLKIEETSFVKDWQEVAVTLEVEALKLRDAGGDTSAVTAASKEIFTRENFLAYTPSRSTATSLRNLIMTLTCILSGRRSKELQSLTLREFEAKERVAVCSGESGNEEEDSREQFYRIEARSHKTAKYDQRCFIIVDEKLSVMMEVFKVFYRPVITASTHLSGVFFPGNSLTVQPSSSCTSLPSKLSFTGIAVAMKTIFVKRCGLWAPRGFSSRYVRQAFSSAAREVGKRHSELEAVAGIMCHRVSTAEKFYTLGSRATTSRQVALIRQLKKDVRAGEVGTTVCMGDERVEEEVDYDAVPAAVAAASGPSPLPALSPSALPAILEQEENEEAVREDEETDHVGGVVDEIIDDKEDDDDREENVIEDGGQNTIDSVAFANMKVMKWLNDMSFKAPVDRSTSLLPHRSSSPRVSSVISSSSPVHSLHRRGTLRSLPAPECRETPSAISLDAEEGTTALEPLAKRRKR